MSEAADLYQSTQRRNMLVAILWVVMVVALLLGVFNLQFRTWPSIISLFALALLCIPLLLLNARGNYLPAAAVLSLLVLGVINISIIDGDGILDPGILAYPVFVMVGTLFFGKRAAPVFAAGAILSVIGLVFLEVRGDLVPTIGTRKYTDLIPITILLVAAAAIIWVIIDRMERGVLLVRRSMSELRRNYDLTLEAWAHVLENRDRETEGHSRRLMDLSTRLAKALGCDETQIANLRRGALVHDIGKLAIPDSILLKPSELNEQEREIVRQHPQRAVEMLSGIGFLEPALVVPASHHEQWDGGGYPVGLKGEAIPFLARIFSVVDTWDALNSARPYREAWPRERSIQYLRENAGRKFDPHIVDIFLGLV